MWLKAFLLVFLAGLATPASAKVDCNAVIEKAFGGSVTELRQTFTDKTLGYAAKLYEAKLEEGEEVPAPKDDLEKLALTQAISKYGSRQVLDFYLYFTDRIDPKAAGQFLKHLSKIDPTDISEKEIRNLLQLYYQSLNAEKPRLIERVNPLSRYTKKEMTKRLLFDKAFLMLKERFYELGYLTPPSRLGGIAKALGRYKNKMKIIAATGLYASSLILSHFHSWLPMYSPEIRIVDPGDIPEELVLNRLSGGLDQASQDLFATFPKQLRREQLVGVSLDLVEKAGLFSFLYYMVRDPLVQVFAVEYANICKLYGIHYIDYFQGLYEQVFLPRAVFEKEVTQMLMQYSNVNPDDAHAIARIKHSVHAMDFTTLRRLAGH